MYFSYRDRPSRAGEMHLRTRPGAEGGLAGLVRGALRDLDPATPVFNVRTLTDHVENNLFLRRIPARLFMGLGPLLLALAAIGIYAVVAFTVTSRTAEIGVRLALGATARRVVGEVVARSLSVIGMGAALGWLSVWTVYARFFGVPTDVLSFTLVPALLLAVAGVSCWLPARRAAGIDPATALKRD
jgi:cell division protein FtsX